MFELTISTQFKRDLKLARKHGFDESILDDIIKLLIAGKSLPKKNKITFLSAIIKVVDNVISLLIGF